MMDTRADNNSNIIAKRAAGYAIKAGTATNASYIDIRILSVAVVLISTTGKIYKWDLALITNKIFSETSRNKMWTPGKNNYAYG